MHPDRDQPPPRRHTHADPDNIGVDPNQLTIAGQPLDPWQTDDLIADWADDTLERPPF